MSFAKVLKDTDQHDTLFNSDWPPPRHTRATATATLFRPMRIQPLRNSFFFTVFQFCCTNQCFFIAMRPNIECWFLLAIIVLVLNQSLNFASDQYFLLCGVTRGNHTYIYIYIYICFFYFLHCRYAHLFSYVDIYIYIYICIYIYSIFVGRHYLSRETHHVILMIR